MCLLDGLYSGTTLLCLLCRWLHGGELPLAVSNKDGLGKRQYIRTFPNPSDVNPPVGLREAHGGLNERHFGIHIDEY